MHHMSHHTCIAWRITCVPVMYHMAHYVCITCRIACVVSHQHNRTLLLRAPLALAVYHAATHCCVSRQHERTLLLRAPLAPRCVPQRRNQCYFFALHWPRPGCLLSNHTQRHRWLAKVPRQVSPRNFPSEGGQAGGHGAGADDTHPPPTLQVPSRMATWCLRRFPLTPLAEHFPFGGASNDRIHPPNFN